MKVIIFGATGKTGRHAWREALEVGHEVTAFARSPAKIEHDHPNLSTFRGDVFNTAQVDEAVVGHDAAIVCLGSTSLRDKTTLATGTENVIDAMARHGVARAIDISAGGVGESWAQIPWSSRVLFKTMLRNLFADHLAQEALVKASPLEWTIVRSAVLTDKASTGTHTATNTGPIRRITRADLAGFLVAQLTDKTHVRQAISVTA